MNAKDSANHSDIDEKASDGTRKVLTFDESRVDTAAVLLAKSQSDVPLDPVAAKRLRWVWLYCEDAWKTYTQVTGVR
jgi:hypothetical protein